MAKLGWNRVQVAVILLMSLARTAHPIHAQTRVPMTFGDIEITLPTTPQGASSHGYSEYVFLVRNQSSEQTHTVGLSIPFERHYVRGDSIRDLRRTVQVGANETVRFSLFQPDYPPIDGRNVAVFIDGQRRQRDLQLKPNEASFGSRRYRSMRYSRYSTSSSVKAEPLVLIGSRVRPLPQQEGGVPIGMAGGTGGPGGGGSGLPPAATQVGGMHPMPRRVPVPGGEIEVAPIKPGLPPNSHQPVNAEAVETWSSNWLGYSRYDCVLVTADELKTMPESVRSALWQYVETGGFLFVIGPADLRGLSTVSETTPDPAGWITVRAGFGKCVISPNGEYEKWDLDHYQRLSQDWTAIAAGWTQPERVTTAANREFPVVEDLGIPVKGLFVLMFLFTLGIGPINLLFLSRLKRRIWMLWTTPVISLATCVAVFGYMLISEGWEGQLRSETLTLLDETTHRATTIGWTGVYSPLTPSDGLHFSYETEMIPQRFFEGEQGGARACTIDWSQDQHLATGWVEARVPAHFKVRKSEMRRERVTLQREADGHWSMVNGLGAEIRRFFYVDRKGQVHKAEDIPAGARAMLTLTEKESQPQPKNVGGILFSPNWMSQMKDLATKPEHYLRPGNYLAEVDDSPFLEDTLRNAKKRKTHALIMGFRQPSG
jgi:hypothetical protein